MAPSVKYGRNSVYLGLCVELGVWKAVRLDQVAHLLMSKAVETPASSQGWIVNCIPASNQGWIVNYIPATTPVITNKYPLEVLRMGAMSPPSNQRAPSFLQRAWKCFPKFINRPWTSAAHSLFTPDRVISLTGALAIQWRKS